MGIAVKREYIIILDDGTILLEWEGCTGVDLLKGEFTQYEPLKYAHPVLDSDLDMLKRAGRVLFYDAREVIINSLPEVPDKKLIS